MTSCGTSATDVGVHFQGQEVTLGVAIEQTVKGSQGMLNALEFGLIQMAAQVQSEQEIDESDDFQKACETESQISATVDDFVELLGDLKQIAVFLRGDPPNSDMTRWYAKYAREQKAVRKQALELKKIKAQADATQRALAKMSLD